MVRLIALSLYLEMHRNMWLSYPLFIYPVSGMHRLWMQRWVFLSGAFRGVHIGSMHTHYIQVLAQTLPPAQYNETCMM